jgi:hypothetical protein
MHKQDLFIAIVSVCAIVYVILFDSTMAGLFTHPGDSASPISSPLATGAPLAALRPRDPAPVEPRRPDGDDRLLVIEPEGGLTSQGRARLMEEVRGWLERPIPGELDRLRDDYEAISQLADSIAQYRLPLDGDLARAFQDKINEIRRTYLLQRTTTELGDLATNYAVPAASERERVQRELARLKELSHDVDWVEERYNFVYPQDRKAYLHQLIEVLEGMLRVQ